MNPSPSTARVSQRSRRRVAFAAFTLVELMISLTVGGIALGSIYAIGAASSRHFREQQRISTTQTSVRLAMEILKKDFQRAGYLASPNANLQAERCGGAAPSAALTPGNTVLGAISQFVDAVPNNPAPPVFVDPIGANKDSISLDTVTLIGNYSTTGEYPISTAGITGGKAVLPQTSQSFRRDFFPLSANPTTADTAAVQAAFAVGRMVRVHAPGDTYFFTTVAGAASLQSGNIEVPLTSPSAPVGCSVNSGWINPVNKIQYHVAGLQATDAEAERFTVPGVPVATGSIGILRRTEVDPTAAPVNGVITKLAAGDDRSILDYVVSFNLRFLMSVNGALNRSVPNTVTWTPTTNLNNLPEHAIAVIIDLAARTPTQEPDVPWITGQIGTFIESGPRTFRVTDKFPGAARVRSAHAELLLPNIAYKGY